MRRTTVRTVDDAPLILTLLFDPRSQGWFEALRRRYFPPERNLVPAHLTLFHALPAAHEAAVRHAVAAEAARPPFRLTVTGVAMLGRGAAFRIESRDLAAMHAAIARSFAACLTPQDRQPFRPHVVLQNKVAPDAARATASALAEQRPPNDVRAEALVLWRYRGGPWERAASFAFGGAEAPQLDRR